MQYRKSMFLCLHQLLVSLKRRVRCPICEIWESVETARIILANIAELGNPKFTDITSHWTSKTQQFFHQFVIQGGLKTLNDFFFHPVDEILQKNDFGYKKIIETTIFCELSKAI